MRQFLLVAALLVALCNTDLSAAPLSDAEIAAMLAAHNAVRQHVAQAESLRLGGTVSIPDLTWNPSVAAIAQAHADSLINSNPPKGQHRRDEELQQLGLGENWYLAWSTGTPDQSASVAVESPPGNTIGQKPYSVTTPYKMSATFTNLPPMRLTALLMRLLGLAGARSEPARL